MATGSRKEKGGRQEGSGAHALCEVRDVLRAIAYRARRRQRRRLIHRLARVPDTNPNKRSSVISSRPYNRPNKCLRVQWVWCLHRRMVKDLLLDDGGGCGRDVDRQVLSERKGLVQQLLFGEDLLHDAHTI